MGCRGGAHLKGLSVLRQAATKYFKEQNYGKVINVSSVAGIVRTIRVNYAAARAVSKLYQEERCGVGSV
jgi:NAD(P)-dependent dehydrogenase (short-subunit alcohol dehydrogenase family)